ncbi:hypothetical protein [Angustibacter aerolatus]
MSQHQSAGSTADEHTAFEGREALLAKLFDLRTFIGSLFVIFGVVVTIEGLGASAAELAKADGLRLSLWTGLAMLVLGVLFIVWMLVSPPEPPDAHRDDLGGGPGQGGDDGTSTQPFGS